MFVWNITQRQKFSVGIGIGKKIYLGFFRELNCYYDLYKPKQHSPQTFFSFSDTCFFLEISCSTAYLKQF